MHGDPWVNFFFLSQTLPWSENGEQSPPDHSHQQLWQHPQPFWPLPSLDYDLICLELLNQMAVRFLINSLWPYQLTIILLPKWLVCQVWLHLFICSCVGYTKLICSCTGHNTFTCFYAGYTTFICSYVGCTALICSYVEYATLILILLSVPLMVIIQ